MRTLSDCIEKYGEGLDAGYITEIRAAANKNKSEGYDAHQAEMIAVAGILEGVQGEHQAILDQLEFEPLTEGKGAEPQKEKKPSFKDILKKSEEEKDTFRKRVATYKKKHGDKPVEFKQVRKGLKGEVIGWQGAAIHKNNRADGEQYPFQITSFDERGFIGDSVFKTEEEAIEEAYTLGFRRTTSPGFLDKKAVSKKFIEGNNANEKAHKEWNKQAEEDKEKRRTHIHITPEGKSIKFRLVNAGAVKDRWQRWDGKANKWVTHEAKKGTPSVKELEYEVAGVGFRKSLSGYDYARMKDLRDQERERKRTARATKAKTFRAWVKAIGGLTTPSMLDHGLLDSKEYLGIRNKKGYGIDEILSMAITDGWLPPNATEQDVVEAIIKNIKKPADVEESIAKGDLSGYNEDYDSYSEELKHDEEIDDRERKIREATAVARQKEEQSAVQNEDGSISLGGARFRDREEFDQYLDTFYGPAEEQPTLELTPEEPTDYEKIERLKREGRVKSPEKKKETLYWKGDLAQYTGKEETLHGGKFYEIELLEGHLKGEFKLTKNPPKKKSTFNTEEGIKANVVGKQTGMFGNDVTGEQEQVNLEDVIQERKDKEAQTPAPKEDAIRDKEEKDRKDAEIRENVKKVREKKAQRKEKAKPANAPSTGKEQKKLANAVKRLRKVAETSKKRAEEKYNQDRNTNTSRRARMAASSQSNAAYDIAIAETMIKIADGIENGELKALKGLTAKTQVESLDRLLKAAQRSKYYNYSEQKRREGEPVTEEDAHKAAIPTIFVNPGLVSGLKRDLSAIRGGKKLSNKIHGEHIDPGLAKEILDFAKKHDITKSLPWALGDQYKRVVALKRMGITNNEELRSALVELVNVRSPKKKEDPIKEKERELIGNKGIGIDFFPTPKALADKMVEMAEIKPGMSVLEPSAGKGDLAEAIKEAEPEADIKTVEMSYTLRELLELKGFDVVGHDFLDYTGEHDRIIMNPPFSKGMDIDHVRHAYDQLKPGGRIVSIMGEHPFFANDKKSEAFREWLEDKGHGEKLPAGSFTGKDAFNQTGVNSRVVVLDKPDIKVGREDFEERKDRRAERYERASDRAAERSEAGRKSSDAATRGIPMGQPILVGHHSEKGHRAAMARSDRGMRKAIDEGKKADRYAEKAEAARNNTSISSDDPEALVKLRDKIAKAEKDQASYKTVNKIVRSKKLSDVEKIDKLQEELGLKEATARVLLEPDRFGDLGVPSYRLQNNNANIRRMKQRLVQIEKQYSDKTTTIKHGDIKIVDNVEENRLQIFFPGKPEEAVRKQLRSNGFKWAKSVGAWQRFRSTQAMWSAKDIVGIDSKAEGSYIPTETDPNEVKEQGNLFGDQGGEQLSLNFGEKKPLAEKTDGLPQAQRVHYATTGNIEAEKRTVSTNPRVAPSDVATLLHSSLKNRSNERLYVVSVAEDGTILEVLKYVQGTSYSVSVSGNEVAGHVLSVPNVFTVYLVHNHPAGDPGLSPEDVQLSRGVRELLRAGKDLDVQIMALGDDTFAVEGVSSFDPIKPVEKSAFSIPIIKRKYLLKEKMDYPGLLRPGLVFEFLNEHLKAQEGILLMDRKNKPVAFVPFVKGKTARNTTRELLVLQESSNATTAIVVNSDHSPGRVRYIENLIRMDEDKKAMLGDLTVFDLIDNGKSYHQQGGFSPYKVTIPEDERYDVLMGQSKLSATSTKPWAKDFPNAILHTTVRKLKDYPGYNAAKGGDDKSAVAVVRGLLKVGKAKKLGKQYPNAVLVPVISLEKDGFNKLPIQFANALSDISGLSVDGGIIQSNYVNRTNKNNLDRLFTIVQFKGKVTPGQQYILVDDGIGQGGTLSELRHHIENNGGEVVAVTSLSAGIFGARLHIRPETIEKIEAKHGRSETEKFLREYDIAGTLEALTEKQAREILSPPSLDALRGEATKRGHHPVYPVREGPVQKLSVSSPDNTPYTLSPKEFKNARRTLRLFRSWMKKAGLPDEVMARIDTDLQPFISLQGKNVKKSLDQYNGKIETILGITTINRLRALVEVSLNQSQKSMESTAYHEAFHIAMDWLITPQDKAKLLKHFATKEDPKGNEEDAAKAYADFVMKQVKARELETWLRRIFRKIKKAIRVISEGLKGKGWSRPEDFFGKLYLGAYRPHFAAAGERTGVSMSATAPPFFSQLIRTVETNIKQMPGKAQAVMNWLQKKQVKPAEMKWMGVEQWVKDNQKDGKIDREAFLEFLKSNEIQVEEITKKGFGEAVESGEELNLPKFERYTLPGGENYRELLFTLPIDQNAAHAARSERVKQLIARRDELEAQPRSEETQRQIRNTETQIDMAMREPDDKAGYKSAHYDEPNVLGHVRFNERQDSEGNRVLFIEEIQSDLHQEGKKKGYNGDHKPLTAKEKAEINSRLLHISNERDDAYNEKDAKRLRDLENESTELQTKLMNSDTDNTVPQAPFADNWHEVLFKRMLRYAAENGFDKLAWTTGERQAERYDLSKHISELHYSGSNLKAYDHNGITVIAETGVTEEKLPDYIGKEATKKLLAQPKRGTLRSLEGQNLKVGGDGMKSFYDSLLPGFAKKYGKQWGSKVGESKIDTIHGAKEMGDHLDRQDNPDFGYEPVHSISITDSMRQSVVMDGQSWFNLSKDQESAKDKAPSQPLSKLNATTTTENLSKNFQEDTLSAFEFVRDVIKNRSKNRKNRKADTSAWDRILSTPLDSFRKVPALWRMFEAGLSRSDNYYSMVDRLTIDADGKYHTKRIDDFRKQHKKQYAKFTRYLKHRDQNQIGYSVQMEDDTVYHLFNYKGKKVSTFQTEELAWEAAIQAELKDFVQAGYSEEAARSLESVRRISHRGFNVLVSNMRDLVAKYKRLKLELPKISIKQDGKQVEVDLQEALVKMGDIRGFYMPRTRRPGRIMLTAHKKGEHPIMEFFDTDFFASKRETPLLKQGYKVNVKLSTKLPEDVFEMAGNVVAMQATINEALERIKTKNWDLEDFGLRFTERGQGPGRRDFMVVGPANKEQNKVFKKLGGRFYSSEGQGKAGPRVWHFENPGRNFQKRLSKALALEKTTKIIDHEIETLFAGALAEQVANAIKGRGARAHMIGRDEAKGKDVWIGYEEDPALAMAQYARSIAAGEAKRVMAVSLLRNFTGTDISWQEFLKVSGDGTTYKDYIDFVEERRISPTGQPNAFKEAKVYMEDMLRNDEAIDRVVGTIKGIAVLKYLALRVSAPLVNLTALVTSVPAAMKGYGKIPLHKTPGLLKNASKEYGKYLSHKKWPDRFPEDTNPEYRKLFTEIEEKGWHTAQYNREALSVLQNKAGRGWSWLMETSMAAFGATEQLNRVATIVAAYNGVKEGKNHDEAMRLAKDISDRSHGVYGKANLPHLARGSNIAAQAMRSFYVFKTFSHNYLLTMKDLGMNQKDAKATLFMAFAPAVLAGGGAFVGTGIIAAIAQAFGADDPEEWLYDQMGEHIGRHAETLGRFGAFGLAGISLKGSLEIGITDIPTKPAELLGAPASVLSDVYYGGKSLLHGDISKGIEKILPLGLSSPFKAYREATEGVTTRTNAPLFYGNEPVVADTVDAIYRFFSFNPSRIAHIREEKWSDTKLLMKYTGMRKDIYAKFKKFYLSPPAGRTKADYIDLLTEAKTYNERVISKGYRGIPRITGKSLRTNMRRSFRPSKRERLRSDADL